MKWTFLKSLLRSPYIIILCIFLPTHTSLYIYEVAIVLYTLTTQLYMTYHSPPIISQSNITHHNHYAIAMALSSSAAPVPRFAAACLRLRNRSTFRMYSMSAREVADVHTPLQPLTGQRADPPDCDVIGS